MHPTLTLQQQSLATGIPDAPLFTQWVQCVLSHEAMTHADITIRICDIDEMTQLNTSYRSKLGPTNVLSFLHQEDPIEGDIVLCAPLILEEAQKLNKGLMHHWSHLTVHGTLHLCGYDHIEAHEAEQMAALEIALLAQLGFPNPYAS